MMMRSGEVTARLMDAARAQAARRVMMTAKTSCFQSPLLRQRGLRPQPGLHLAFALLPRIGRRSHFRRVICKSWQANLAAAHHLPNLALQVMASTSQASCLCSAKKERQDCRPLLKRLGQMQPGPARRKRLKRSLERKRRSMTSFSTAQRARTPRTPQRRIPVRLKSIWPYPGSK